MQTQLRSHSVADLGRTLTETIDRVGQQGGPEIVTVDGQPRVVLISMAEYEGLAQAAEGDDEAVTDEDVRVMQRSIEQIKRGEYMTAEAFFDKLQVDVAARATPRAGSQS